LLGLQTKAGYVKKGFIFILVRIHGKGRGGGYRRFAFCKGCCVVWRKDWKAAREKPGHQRGDYGCSLGERDKSLSQDAEKKGISSKQISSLHNGKRLMSIIRVKKPYKLDKDNFNSEILETTSSHRRVTKYTTAHQK
jgi:hypothetical protein